jgi:hypothetical protein
LNVWTFEQRWTDPPQHLVPWTNADRMLSRVIVRYVWPVPQTSLLTLNLENAESWDKQRES